MWKAGRELREINPPSILFIYSGCSIARFARSQTWPQKKCQSQCRYIWMGKWNLKSQVFFKLLEEVTVQLHLRTMLKTLDQREGGGGGRKIILPHLFITVSFLLLIILVFLLTTRILLDHGFLRQISPWFAIFHPSYKQLTIVIPFFFRWRKTGRLPITGSPPKTLA